MKNKVVYEVLDLAFPVQLLQSGRDSFDVVYGKQVRIGLSYADAAKEFGLALMHAAGCDGRLDGNNPVKLAPRYLPSRHPARKVS